MTTVKLPRLLDATGGEKTRLHPSALSLSLQLRGTSTATMTLATETVQMHDFVELFTAKGSAGIFRVTNAVNGEDGQTVTLMHAIDTLTDSLWRAQEDFTGTVEEFLTALLGKQTTVLWQLGECEDTNDYPKSGLNYNKLSELLAEVEDNEIGYYFDYDFSTTPWTLNLLALPETVAAEFRLTRNVETAEITRNDGEMCNRLHLSVTNSQTHAQSVTVYNNTASQSVYGIIEKAADIDTSDVADPAAWAADFLAQRAEPAVQIDIDGYELAALTGETWDEFSRGKLVRVALGYMGEIVTERVVSVDYPDAIGTPERVSVQLANKLPRFSETIASLVSKAGGAAKSARSASRAIAGQAAKTNAIQLVVEDHTEALDSTGISELWESGINITAWGTDITALYQGEESLASSISVNADGISNLVTKTGINSLGQAETLYSKITQNANRIALIVDANGIKPAEIIAAINGSTSSVTISADKINLNGYTFAENQAISILRAGTSYFYSPATFNDSLTVNGGTLQILNGALSMPTGTSMSFHGYGVSWHEQRVATRTSIPIPTVTTSVKRKFAYLDDNGNVAGFVNGYVLTNDGSTSDYSLNTTTIHYLGRANT